jgi:hypothetical protein
MEVPPVKEHIENLMRCARAALEFMADWGLDYTAEYAELLQALDDMQQTMTAYQSFEERRHADPGKPE